MLGSGLAVDIGAALELLRNETLNPKSYKPINDKP